MNREDARFRAGTWTLLVCLVFGFAGGVQVYGQILHAVGSAPSFEVATIKPSEPGAAVEKMIGPKGTDRFVTRNTTVRDLIEFAFTTDSGRQIVGLSGWALSRRYDIDAKVGDAEIATILGLPPIRRMDPYRLMQQSLLADRFRLRVHFEARDLPIYVLVVAKGGPRLKASAIEPSNAVATVKPRLLQMIRPGNAAGVGVTVGMLAELLERQADLGSGSGRTVSDQTNLTGLYDFTLHWTPWQDLPDENSAATTGPSLFTALEEQLGLKLESRKGYVEVVIVDEIELPSEN